MKRHQKLGIIKGSAAGSEFNAYIQKEQKKVTLDW